MTIIKQFYLNDWNQIQLSNWTSIVNGSSVVLISPYNLYRCNLCWDISHSMLTDIMQLYENKPFYLHNTHYIDSSDLLFEGKILEMKLKIHRFKKIYQEKNNIIVINTKNIDLWSKIFTHAINLNYKTFSLFIQEFAKLPHINFFILYLNNIPVGTSMLNIYNNDDAVISSVAVLNKFRNQGLGQIIISKTIQYAYECDIKSIYIYSIEEINDLYKNLEFSVIKKLYLYKKYVNANTRI